MLTWYNDGDWAKLPMPLLHNVISNLYCNIHTLQQKIGRGQPYYDDFENPWTEAWETWGQQQYYCPLDPDYDLSEVYGYVDLPSESLLELPRAPAYDSEQLDVPFGFTEANTRFPGSECFLSMTPQFLSMHIQCIRNAFNNIHIINQPHAWDSTNRVWHTHNPFYHREFEWVEIWKNAKRITSIASLKFGTSFRCQFVNNDDHNEMWTLSTLLTAANQEAGLSDYGDQWVPLYAPQDIRIWIQLMYVIKQLRTVKVHFWPVRPCGTNSNAPIFKELYGEEWWKFSNPGQAAVNHTMSPYPRTCCLPSKNLDFPGTVPYGMLDRTYLSKVIHPSGASSSIDNSPNRNLDVHFADGGMNMSGYHADDHEHWTCLCNLPYTKGPGWKYYGPQGDYFMNCEGQIEWNDGTPFQCPNPPINNCHIPGQWIIYGGKTIFTHHVHHWIIRDMEHVARAKFYLIVGNNRVNTCDTYNAEKIKYCTDYLDEEFFTRVTCTKKARVLKTLAKSSNREYHVTPSNSLFFIDSQENAFRVHSGTTQYSVVKFNDANWPPELGKETIERIYVDPTRLPGGTIPEVVGASSLTEWYSIMLDDIWNPYIIPDGSPVPHHLEEWPHELILAVIQE
jgi:hypothetical protein